jgi:hypothetical protein
MQFRKLSAYAVTTSFILFTFGQLPTRAAPGSEMFRDGEETRVEAEAADPHAGEAAEATKPPVQGKTLSQKGGGTKTTKTLKGVGTKNANTLSAPPRGLAGKAKAKARPGRKSRRESPASIAAHRLYDMKRKYILRTHHSFMVTSYRRGPTGQARAIRQNLRAYGVRYVLHQYRSSAAIREILRTYRANRRGPQKAMTRVIEAQVARGVYVSRHMLGCCADVRSHGRGAARLSVLREVAHEVGAKVSVENNHYHVNLV